MSVFYSSTINTATGLTINNPTIGSSPVTVGSTSTIKPVKANVFTTISSNSIVVPTGGTNTTVTGASFSSTQFSLTSNTLVVPSVGLYDINIVGLMVNGDVNQSYSSGSQLLLGIYKGTTQLLYSSVRTPSVTGNGGFNINVSGKLDITSVNTGLSFQFTNNSNLACSSTFAGSITKIYDY
jgi:hypothetical protein